MQRTLMLGLAAIASFTIASAAQAQPGVKAGVLSCEVSGGWGFVFGSSKDMNCTFSPNQGEPEHYVGSINKYGVDIGYTRGGIMVWAVLAPGDVGRGALAGNYGGVTAGEHQPGALDALLDGFGVPSGIFLDGAIDDLGLGGIGERGEVADALLSSRAHLDGCLARHLHLLVPKGTST